LALCEEFISKVVVDRVLINAKPARSGAKLSS
jgi:hypothetical protein